MLSTLSACRQESDNLYNYAYNDALVNMNANDKFGDKFKMLWHGLDQNYAIFDYEAEYGLDWDKVYDEYLPQFEALDELDNVTDKELETLLEKVVAPLHDGHIAIQMKNHLTGNYVNVVPADLRNQSRDDYKIADNYMPDLSSYVISDLKEYASASTRFKDFWYEFFNEKKIGMKWIVNKITKLQGEISLTSGTTSEHDAYMLENYMTLYGRLYQLKEAGDNGANISELVNSYNELVVSYAFLEVPGMYTYDPSFVEDGVEVTYALTNENIAYFQFSDFHLSTFLDPSSRNRFAQSSPGTQTMVNQVVTVWQQWFDAIQYHHKAGDLKGVIIDVRGNGGGNFSDFDYVLGALIPSGNFEMAKSRFKRGTGRFDYSIVMPFTVKAYSQEHVAVTEPIVILTNCNSVSMSEITTQGVKCLPNGKQIGKRTWGGLCALSDAQSYSQNYSGYVGIQNQTPVFCYVPQMALMNQEEQIMEGVGLTPDIEVNFDETLYKTTGRDSQYERAIEYITKGK